MEAIIEPAFPDRKYNLSNNTWLIWHNVKFEKLNNGLRKESNKVRLKNAKSFPILISTGNTVMFTLNRPLSPPEFSELASLAIECANEKIDHKLIEGKDYIKCPSTITAVLLYFHQTNKKQKSIKFSKLPANIPPDLDNTKDT